MKRFLPWIGVAVAIPTVLCAAFLLRSRETQVIYRKSPAAKEYRKSEQVVENSWQVRAADWLLSLIELGPLPPIVDNDLGVVDARQVPCLDDKEVAAVLGRLEPCSVIAYVGVWSSEENEMVRKSIGLMKPHDFTAFIVIFRTQDGKTRKKVSFAFDRQRALVGMRSEDRQTGVVVIDAFAAGETPHRETTRSGLFR